MLHPRCGARYRGMTIGLLGGSFNPAHEGHRTMSLYAMKRLGLDQIWWLVSPQNPLKSTDDMAPLDLRMASAERVSNHPRIIVTDIESQLGTRYTADTLSALQRRFGATRFIWLMGADNLKQIPDWQEWESIFRSVPVAVFRRPGYPAGRGMGKAAIRFNRSWVGRERALCYVKTPLPAWRVLDNPLNTLSATQIRREQTKWQRDKKLRP